MSHAPLKVNVCLDAGCFAAFFRRSATPVEVVEHLNNKVLTTAGVELTSEERQFVLAKVKRAIEEDAAALGAL